MRRFFRIAFLLLLILTLCYPIVAIAEEDVNDTEYVPSPPVLIPINCLQYLVPLEKNGSVSEVGACWGESGMWGSITAFHKRTADQENVAGMEAAVSFMSNRPFTPFIGYGLMAGYEFDHERPVAGIFLDGGLRYRYKHSFQLSANIRAYATTQCCDDNVFVGLEVSWSPKWAE